MTSLVFHLHTKQRSEADLHAAEERRRETSQLLDEANQRAQNAERRALEAQARGREGEHWILQREEIVSTERELGRGGWGMVKVAKFRGINVAAKQLFQQISQFYRLSFIREMNMAARIRHPNLVQFIGATLDREPIILTELMSTSLRAVLERGPISHAQVVSISLDVARALNYLHLMKPDPIIHRDISSANVLLNPLPNNCWKAKISDYGSVNLLRQLNTVGPGSPVYAAPEAGVPASQSPKMDIFSFGVLLIEMITDTFPEVALRRTLIDSIQHRGLLELVQRCINEEKNNRPSSAEVITELSEI